MRVQVFPLLARLRALQRFCDEWFNDHVPPQVAVFRPALPVVFCTVLQYPELGGELPWRTGSLSQNEVYFLVPLERYQDVDGQLRFVEPAVTTPYIFVDNPESTVSGRERFGMPKQDAVFSAGRGLPWPTGAQQYMSISGWEPSVAGHRLGPLLDIVRHPPFTPAAGVRDDDFLLPPSGRPSLTTMLRLVPMLADAVGGALGPATSDVVERVRAYLAALWNERRINLFSLRQFADPLDPERARYQDLVSFRMQVTDVQGLGLLGRNLLRPELSLLVYRSEIRPIVRRLGLVVRQRHSGTHYAEALEVLDSFLPFYAQTDVELLESRRLCWRAYDSTHWQDEDGGRLAPTPRPVFNRGLGPSAAAYLENQAEPAILDVKFMMLPARRRAVMRVVQQIMPHGAPYDVEPLGTGELAAIRVLAYHSRPRGPSEQEALMWMDGTYLSISVPVTLHGRGEPCAATLMLHDFASNTFMVQGLRETLAGPTSHAQFDFGVHGWFSTTHPVAPVFGVSTMTLERSATGAKVVPSPLLDVLAGEVPAADTVIARQEIERLRKEVWPTLSTILPVVSIGAIGSPSSIEETVSRRLSLTIFEPPVLLGEGRSHDHSHVPHVIRFHTSESYPIVDRLGLLAYPERSPLAMHLQEGLVGQIHAVPVLAYAEIAMRLPEQQLEVLWEDFSRESRIQPPRGPR